MTDAGCPENPCETTKALFFALFLPVGFSGIGLAKVPQRGQFHGAMNRVVPNRASKVHSGNGRYCTNLRDAASLAKRCGENGR